MLPQQDSGYSKMDWVLLSLKEFDPWYLLSEIATKLLKGLAWGH